MHGYLFACSRGSNVGGPRAISSRGPALEVLARGAQDVDVADNSDQLATVLVDNREGADFTIDHQLDCVRYLRFRIHRNDVPRHEVRYGTAEALLQALVVAVFD